ncbi:MAG: methyltransferase family protein [Burkholderiales bacterium]
MAQVPIMLGAFAAPILWGQSPFDGASAVQIVGAAVAVLGILLAVAGLVALGNALTPFPRPRDHARLRQVGIYRWVRHPIYGGLVVASLGWTASWLSLPGLFFVLVVFIFFDRKSAFEERLLRAHYPEYGAYAVRVRKLLPGIY